MIVIYSTEQNILDLELKNHIKKYDNFEIIIWEKTIEELYNELNQFNLNLLPRLFVIKNAIFFSNKKDFLIVNKYLELLINSNDQIIITTNNIKSNEDIDNFLKKITFIKINQKSIKNIINEYFKNNKIFVDEDIIENLSNRLPNNELWILNELDKLKYHTSIDQNLINNLINDYQSFEIFKMSEAILTNNLKLTMILFSKAIKNNISIEEILAILSSYFLKIYFLKKEINNNENIEIIIKNYSINKFWFMNIFQILKNISINKLKYILNILFNFDLESKTINFDKYLNFKLLLLNFFKD